MSKPNEKENDALEARVTHVLGSREGEHWIVEYRFLPEKWTPLSLPFPSEDAAEKWWAEFCLCAGMPADVAALLIKARAVVVVKEHAK